MIQRIQSIYLLLSAIVTVLFMFLPLATLFTPGAPVIFSAIGVCEAGSGNAVATILPLTIVSALAVILPLVNIFLYRNRPLQIRVCGFTTLMLLAIYATFGIYVFNMSNTLQAESVQWGAALSMPFVALVLNIIAQSKVRADERLVRSADRLR